MLAKLSLMLVLAGLALSAVAAAPVPADVQKFIDEREMCEHFLGEMPDPGQKKRARGVNKAIKESCTGTDKALAALKKKYAKNAAVMKQLEEQDPHIGM